MSDEELGKKDDDHKLVNSASQRRSSSWQPARVPPRRSLKRIGLVFVVAAFVYLFVHNIPILGPDNRMRRPEYPHTLGRPPSRPNKPPPEIAMHPPDPAAQAQTQTQAQAPALNTVERNFNGPIKFVNLAVSLQAISSTRGSQVNNKNILFAAASLKSAATLLPMACQMGMGLKNYVHFALLGRSDIHMDRLWEINGIDKSCIIIFHGMAPRNDICRLLVYCLADHMKDARPNYAGISTDGRLEKSVFRGFRMYKPLRCLTIFKENTNTT